jgi:hypothetical protein
MKTTTEILDEALVSMEAARYRITIECSYSDTLRIHTKILEAAASLENAIKETRDDDAKHAHGGRERRSGNSQQSDADRVKQPGQSQAVFLWEGCRSRVVTDGQSGWFVMLCYAVAKLFPLGYRR